MGKSTHAVIIRMQGPGGYSVRSVESDRFVIGRVGADFLIPDKGISRSHLTVLIRGRDIWIEDMGSANGTFVGEQKLAAQTPTQYEPGKPVRLGVCKDLVTFEIAERVMTLAESEAEARELAASPSRALSLPAPNEDVAAQADAFIREAREFANKLKDSAAKEGEDFVRDAKAKAQEVLTKAKSEAEQMITHAKTTSTETMIARETAAEEALNSARKEALQIKTEADEEAEKIGKDARMTASHIKAVAQTEAEELLRSAREKAGAMKAKAESEAMDILRETREKSRSALEKTDHDIELALREAREMAARIRAEADQILEKADAHVQDKGAAFLKEAREQAERLRLESEAEAKRLLDEARLDANRVREEARTEVLRTSEVGMRDAQMEIERVKEEARREITNLQASQKRMADEMALIEKRRQEMAVQAEAVQKKSEAVVAERDQLLQEFEALKEEGGKVKAELALMRTQKEQAEKDQEQALKTKRDAEAEAERIRKEAHEQRSELARELKEMRDKALMEFQSRRKNEDAEITNMKLKWIEEMKARQFEEDQKQRTIRTHQVAEVARHLEIMLVPKIQAKLGDIESTKIVAEIKEEIEPTVRKVMLDDQTNGSGNSDIEGVISADPIIEKLKRRQQLKIRSAFGGMALALFMAIFLPNLFAGVRNPLGWLADGKTLEQLVEEEQQRKLASLPSFNPQLKDEVQDTYTDSVIFTRLYAQRKLDKNNNEKWTKELDSFLYREMGVEELAVGFIGAETALVERLKDLRGAIKGDSIENGIKKMREAEAAALDKLKSTVGGDSTYAKIRKLEKEFFARTFTAENSEDVGGGPAPASETSAP